MATLVWVAGNSAVGKQTLINRWAGPKAASLRQQLELGSDFIQVDLDEEAIVSELQAGKDVIVKWQAARHKRALVKKVRERRPADRHVVLHVRRPVAENLADFLKCRDGGREAFFAHLQNNLKWSQGHRVDVNEFFNVIYVEEYQIAPPDWNDDHLRNDAN